MSYQVVEERTKKLGFCCPYSYFFTTAATGTIDQAKELGVSRRTARRWMRDYYRETLVCQAKAKCFFRDPTLLQKCRDSSPGCAEGPDQFLTCGQP